MHENFDYLFTVMPHLS